MTGFTSLHQVLLTFLLIAWLLVLIIAWVRFEKLPHAKLLLIAVLLWPTLMVDEAIRAFQGWQTLIFLSGSAHFVPAVIVILLFLSVRRLVLEKPVQNYLKYFVVCAPLIVLQMPLLILPAATKLELLLNPPVGNLLTNWPIYTLYLCSAAIILVMAVWVEDMISAYQDHLSEQVVDINYYKMPAAIGLFGGLISAAFAAIVMVFLVAFDLLAFREWQSAINMTMASILLLLLAALLEKRRYAPSPLDYDKLTTHKYSQEHLKDTLTKAEQALIQYKAYKKIGLRIRQLADVADVEPQALAAATHAMLNRNFRAFIYHYRLEYAKKVLMRTDAKVSHVAKKLGFNSEKFLSGVFVKYIRQMGKDNNDDVF